MAAQEQNIAISSETPALTRDEAITKLRELIKGIKIAMLTTVDQTDNSLRSRPMGTQEAEFDGALWFFTEITSDKVHEIENNPRVNLSYADTHGHRYVSISGTAGVVYDRAKMEQYWHPFLKGWFPEGLDSPSLALLRVIPEKAEYWQSDGRIKTMVGLAKALVTHQEVEGVGEYARLDF